MFRDADADPLRVPSSPEPLASRGRGRRCELWLLCAAHRPLEEHPSGDWSARLGQPPVERVLGPPGSDLASIAAALGAPVAWLPALPDDREAAAALAWAALERELEGSARRLLVVLAGPLLQAVVARALGIPPARAGALRVDPGALVLLRDDPIGIVLRRSNVAADEEDTGSALPWTREPSPR